MTDLVAAYRDALLALPASTREDYGSSDAYACDRGARALLRTFLDFLESHRPDDVLADRTHRSWYALSDLERELVGDAIFAALMTNRKATREALSSHDAQRSRIAAEKTAQRAWDEFCAGIENPASCPVRKPEIASPRAYHEPGPEHWPRWLVWFAIALGVTLAFIPVIYSGLALLR